MIDALAAHRKTKFCCTYAPAPMTDVEEHFDLVCQIVRRWQNCIFYIDEVDQFCSANGMIGQRSSYWNRPENKHRTPAFSHMLDSGRHAGIALVMMSRMPAQVNRKVTANCQEMRVFRFSEPNITQYFKDKAGHRMVEKNNQLGEYEYVLWQDGKSPIISGGRS